MIKDLRLHWLVRWPLLKDSFLSKQLPPCRDVTYHITFNRWMWPLTICAPRALMSAFPTSRKQGWGCQWFGTRTSLRLISPGTCWQFSRKCSSLWNSDKVSFSNQVSDVGFRVMAILNSSGSFCMIKGAWKTAIYLLRYFQTLVAMRMWFHQIIQITKPFHFVNGCYFENSSQASMWLEMTISKSFFRSIAL